MVNGTFVLIRLLQSKSCRLQLQFPCYWFKMFYFFLITLFVTFQFSYQTIIFSVLFLFSFNSREDRKRNTKSKHDYWFLFVWVIRLSLRPRRPHINNSPCPILLNHFSQLAGSEHGVASPQDSEFIQGEKSFNFTDGRHVVLIVKPCCN